MAAHQVDLYEIRGEAANEDVRVRPLSTLEVGFTDLAGLEVAPCKVNPHPIMICSGKLDTVGYRTF